MADMLQNLYQEYKNAVSNNSAAIAQFESAFRLVSYMIAGRFQDSTILSELLYSASNLLVLFNDAIIRKASGILPNVPASQERLQSLVTILEYVGVFVEISAHRLFGDVGKWVAITVLQIAKCVCRFLLFAKHHVGIQAVPPLSPIDRDAVMKEVDAKEGKETEENSDSVPPVTNGINPALTVTLSRSGKVMRSLATSSPVNLRDWKLPQMPQAPKPARVVRENNSPSILNRAQMWGECIYIFKPLLHLSSMYLYGTHSFKPWLLSSGLDITSQCLLGDGQGLNQQEKTELRRRSLMLAMYLLRSPFYDRYTKERLLRFLCALSNTVPGLSILLNPLMEYLPVWQQIYFYTWST